MRTWRSLGSTRDFKRVYRSGRVGRGNGITVFASAADAERAPRLGLVLRASLGNAVLRNRIRRRLRAAFSECAPPGVDVVIRVDRNIGEMEYQSLVEDLRRALSEAAA